MGRVPITNEQQEQKEQIKKEKVKRKKELLSLLFKVDYSKSELTSVLLKSDWFDELEKIYKSSKGTIDYEKEYTKLMNKLGTLSKVKTTVEPIVKPIVKTK